MTALRGPLVAMACIAVLAAPASAQPLVERAAACTITFTGAAHSRDWGSAGNWSLNRLPTGTDDVCIPAGFIVFVQGTKAAARALSAPSASLAISDDLAVGSGGAQVGGLDVSAGTVSSAGPLSATALTLSDGTLAGPGTATVSTINVLGGTLNAPLVNAGMLTLSSDLQGTGSLQNATGAVLKSAGDATVAVPIDNDGTLESDAGVLRLTGGAVTASTSAGGFAIADGAAVDFHAGTYALSAPAATGPGSLRVSGAALTVTGAASLGDAGVSAGALLTAGALTAGRVSLSGGTLGGTGSLTLAGLSWSGGALAGTATTTVGGQGLSVSGDAAKTLTDGTLVAGGPSSLDGAGALTLQGAGQLENAGVLDIRSDLPIASTGTGLLVNRPGATLRKSAGALTTLPLPVDNDGTLDVRAGTVRLTGGSGIGETSSGAYTVAGGARLEWAAGAYSLGSPAVTGAAAISGATVSVSGAATASSLTVSGGAAQFGGGLTAGSVALSGGILTGADMTLGALQWTGGTLSGTGTATAGGLALGGAGTKVLRDRTLALTGDSAMDGAGALQLAGTAQLRNAALLDLRGDETILASAPTAKLVNAGTLRKTGSGSANVAVPVDNSGTVQVDAGRLQLASLAGYDPTAMALTGGVYDVTGTLVVPSLVLAGNAATLRLHGSGGVSDGTGDALAGLAANRGTLELTDGAALTLPVAFANAGTVRLDGAKLTTAGDYTQSAGRTSLVGASTLRAGSAVALTGGSLEGTGTVAPLLRNGATVAPSGVLSVAGDYAQTAGGTLRAALGSRLAVSGAAALDGALTVSGTATDGMAVAVLSYASKSGSWASTTLPAADDLNFGLSVGDTAATVTAQRKTAPLPDPSPDPNPTPDPNPVPDPPVPGKQAVIETIKGTVLLKSSVGAAGLGGGFTPLDPHSNIPTGSIVDARKGTVTISTASSYVDPGKPPTTITVSSAIFKVRQVQAAAAGTAVTDLLVQTAAQDKHACASKKGVPRTHTVRHIVASAKGVVRTFGAAAVLSTRNSAAWEMRDRCDGTLATVKSGKAKLFDRIRGHRRTLLARQRLLVKAHLFALKKIRQKDTPKP